ncbi:MAG: hypothetical protein V3S06_07370 [candidate division Zixibacteria bacterium]
MESSERKEIPLYLRVLGYRKSSNSWAAHCLETDLVGYGDSFEAARDNLVELTSMQISFAKFKNQPALLSRPAPPGILEIYNSRLQSMLEGFLGEDAVDSRREITSIPWPVNLSDTDFAIAQV